MRALISDVHANLEALTAVFADIDSQAEGGRDVTDIFFLGDLVGYGPDPEACVDLVAERCDVALKGNHDFALIHGPYGFNYIAAEAIDCTRHTMLPRCLSMDRKKKKRWRFLDALLDQYRENDVLYVHGSPLDPLADYVFCAKSQVMWNEEKLAEVFDKVERLMFCGHTHHPCLIYDTMECFLPAEVDYEVTVDPERKAIVNVGSVGQPRDQDNRASYVLFDEAARTVTWRRIPYDFETTARKIVDTGCIDHRCGERLRLGV